MKRVDHFALVYVTLLMSDLIIPAVCGEGYDFFISNILLRQHKSIFKNLLTRCSELISMGTNIYTWAPEKFLKNDYFWIFSLFIRLLFRFLKFFSN